MLLSYFRLAIRLLIRKPFFSFINVLGLSVGFSMFYVLWQHSAVELASDQFRKDHQRIYRLYFDFYYNTGTDWVHYLGGVFPPVMTSIAERKFSGIESATRIFHQKNFDEVRWEGPQTDTAEWSQLDPRVFISFIGHGNEKYTFEETNTVYADPNVFDFFSIPLLTTHSENVLQNADAMVISSSMARKYFGNDDPVGKTVTINSRESFTITGVFQDLPRNSHLKFDLVMSTSRIKHAIENIHPFQRSAQNYFKISGDASVEELEAQLNKEQKVHWQWDSHFPGATLQVFLQPLREVPFRIFGNDVFVPKSEYILRAYQGVALIILVMAWINYLNLKLSSQSARMKELAARKTSGAEQKDLILQFLVEIVVINCISMMVALTLIQLLKQPLEILLRFHLPGWSEIYFSTVLVFIGIMIVGMTIAALHPAFAFWGKTTHKILSGKLSSRKGRGFVNAMTIVQFVTAMALIVWMFSVGMQVDFVIRDTWGLNRKNVVVVDLPVTGHMDYSAEINYLKNEVLGSPGIDDVALSRVVAGDLVENAIGFRRTDTTSLYVVAKSDGGVDERFISFYGLKLLAGRNFLADNPADKRSVILSRVSAKILGFEPEEAIGKIIRVDRYSWRPFGTDAEIIGVVEDHRHDPLYMETGLANGNRGSALIYGNYLFPDNKPSKMSVRFHGSDPLAVIGNIEKKYRKVFPESFFHWYFLEDHMNLHYQTERVALNQISLFTFIAIGIACLGLLGMISHRVVEKTREIGIRKVLGAQVHQIAHVLLNSTARQVMSASIIGVPLAYYLTQEYLEKFSQRVPLQWWHFALPVVLLVLIMFCTIAAVVWQAARSNPVEALKCE